MEAPTRIEPRRRKFMAAVWITVAVIISASALIQNAKTLHQFYLDTASIAPGTPVRPMGVTFATGLTSTFSLLFGGGCALIGAVVSFIQRKRLLLLFAILTGIFACIPMVSSHVTFMHIIESRKLLLEP